MGEEVKFDTKSSLSMDRSTKVRIIWNDLFVLMIRNKLDFYREWMYLEPIFTSEDIKVQLPLETRKYNAMERNWRRIMKNAYENPYVILILIYSIM